jgi:hypothetical protein
MLGFLQFFLEHSEPIYQGAWIHHPGTGKVASSKYHYGTPHLNLMQKHGMDTSGKGYDAINKGTYHLHPISKKITIHQYDDDNGHAREPHKDVVKHLQNKHQGYSLGESARDVESHIYIHHHPTGAVHFAPYNKKDSGVKNDINFHHELATKHGLPARGPEHTKLERGFIHAEHDKKQLRVRTASHHDFVHKDVISKFQRTHPRTKDYNILDRS